MGAAYQWQSMYETAVLETNDWKLYSKIQAAEAAIQRRYQSNEPDDAATRALGIAMHF